MSAESKSELKGEYRNELKGEYRNELKGEPKIRKVPFHFKYTIKKIDGYGAIKVKIGLILTEIFSPQEGKDFIKPISYVITGVDKYKSFTMSRLLGYDKNLAVIDDTGGIEAILQNGKWRRKNETNSYFVFGISSGIQPHKGTRLIRNGSYS